MTSCFRQLAKCLVEEKKLLVLLERLLYLPYDFPLDLYLTVVKVTCQARVQAHSLTLSVVTTTLMSNPWLLSLCENHRCFNHKTNGKTIYSELNKSGEILNTLGVNKINIIA